VSRLRRAAVEAGAVPLLLGLLTAAAEAEGLQPAAPPLLALPPPPPLIPGASLATPPATKGKLLALSGGDGLVGDSPSGFFVDSPAMRNGSPDEAASPDPLAALLLRRSASALSVGATSVASSSALRGGGGGALSLRRSAAAALPPPLPPTVPSHHALRAALGSVRYLARCPHCAGRLVDGGAAPPLASLLAHPDARVAAQAAVAVKELGYASPEGGAALVACGAVRPLAALLLAAGAGARGSGGDAFFAASSLTGGGGLAGGSEDACYEDADAAEGLLLTKALGALRGLACGRPDVAAAPASCCASWPPPTSCAPPRPTPAPWRRCWRCCAAHWGLGPAAAAARPPLRPRTPPPPAAAGRRCPTRRPPRWSAPPAR